MWFGERSMPVAQAEATELAACCSMTWPKHAISGARNASCLRGMRYMIVKYECKLSVASCEKRCLIRRSGGGVRVAASALNLRRRTRLAARRCALDGAFSPDVDEVKAELLPAYERLAA